MDCDNSVIHISPSGMLLYMRWPYSSLDGSLRSISIGGGESNQNQQQPISIEILEHTADGGSRQHVTNTASHSMEDNELAAGDGHSKTQMKKTRPENSGPMCSIYSFKDSSNKSHVQKDDNLVKGVIVLQTASKV